MRQTARTLPAFHPVARRWPQRNFWWPRQAYPGRERIYFDRIWNDFTGDPGKPDEATRNFFAATYAQPGGMRAGFAQFAAFSQDAKDNKVFEQMKLTMPVMAVGGEKSFGALQAVIMRDEAVVVQITGFGPSSTQYVDATQDPRRPGKSN